MLFQVTAHTSKAYEALIEAFKFFFEVGGQVFFEKRVLKNFTTFTEKHMRQSPVKFCEIFKNIFFYRTLPVTAFGIANWHKTFLTLDCYINLIHFRPVSHAEMENWLQMG